jgi:DNA-binding Xre family transcriptional regulator
MNEIAADGDNVTLTRAQYEALLDAIEDAEDRAIIARHEAQEAAIGTEAYLAAFLPVELVDRLLAGESPVRVWRDHRGLAARELAASAGLAAGYLSEIENGKKPGSLDAMARLAKALRVRIEDLLPLA